jgi:hypothetical protein
MNLNHARVLTMNTTQPQVKIEIYDPDNSDDSNHFDRLQTTRTRLFARWVMQDGKLVCEWIAE